MEQNRVRIVDIAETLGLSTATVSKVIHDKTSKISNETIKRVQQELERTGYGVLEFRFACLLHMFLNGELQEYTHCLLQKKYSGWLYHLLFSKSVNG